MRRTLRVLAVVLSAFPSVGFGDPYTANCLLGYENDRHDKLCAAINPSLREGVLEAQRKWRERNKVALVKLRAACQERLSKAYGSDTDRLNRDRERLLALRDEADQELLRDPEPQNRVNCRAYIKDFSAGGRVDIDDDLIEQTKNNPVPMQWPK